MGIPLQLRYVITLTPASGEEVLKKSLKEFDGPIAEVRMVGYDKPLFWHACEEGVKVKLSNTGLIAQGE